MPTGVRDLTALGPDISIGFYVHNATIVRPLNQFQIFDHLTQCFILEYPQMLTKFFITIGVSIKHTDTRFLVNALKVGSDLDIQNTNKEQNDKLTN